jgi:hypothetical protein
MTIPEVEEANYNVDALVRITELQEALEMYERLQLKQEYLYAHRIIITLLLQINDMPKLQQLLQEFK